MKKALQLPATNAGLTALLGGWVDLLRRSGKITGELVAVGNRLEVRVRSDARQHGVVPGLRGYFADGKTRRIAPPLQLPNMIYSASWYRDYRAIWAARSQLLTAKPLKQLEEGNQTVRKQLSVIGGNVLPSHAFSQLGPHFRVVAVRQLQTEYKVASPNRIPAAGLVIDVRDEKKFRKEVMPLFRAITLILTVAEAKMVPRKTTYKGAELTSVRFRSDPQSLKTANQLRLSFAPTYTVTRGHLIVGSTRTIVEQLIDAIDKQSRERKTISTTATEIQQFSFGEAAAAMRDVQSITSLQQVFGSGLTVREAKAELQIYRRILQAIGRITTHAGFDKNGFEYRIRIGKK